MIVTRHVAQCGSSRPTLTLYLYRPTASDGARAQNTFFTVVSLQNPNLSVTDSINLLHFYSSYKCKKNCGLDTS